MDVAMKNLILIALFACIGLVESRLPPGIFRKCAKNSPDLSKCLIKSFESIRGLLKTGVPEAAVPGFDPFKMDTLSLNTTVKGIRLIGAATDIVARGPGNYKIQSIKLDKHKSSAEITVLIPRLDILADYNVKGSRILMFRVDGAGKFTATFFNVKAVVNIRARIEKRNDLDFIKISELDAEVEFGSGGKIFVEPQDSGKIAKAAADVVNHTPVQKTLSILKDRINQQVTEIVEEYLRKVAKALPLQDLVE